MTVTKDQYTALMKRIYKVLLPLYRHKEMAAEIEQEWLMDSNGQPELTLHLFNKVLFRVAHQWGVNIDLQEYRELLMKVYQRITMKKVICARDNNVIVAHPTIQVEILAPEVDGPDPFSSSEQEQNLEWEDCQSDEEEKAECEYWYQEDKNTLTVKKMKKRRIMKTEGKEDGPDHIPMFPSKEPIIYKEEVMYHQNKGDYRPVGDDYISYMLADEADVFPLGYPAEQFLTWLKNDVATKFEASRKARKEALAKLKREVLEKGGTMKESSVKKEEDTGIVQFIGRTIKQDFDMVTAKPTNVRTQIRMVDTLYNALRVCQKDTKSLTLRLHFEHPTADFLADAARMMAPVGSNDPSTYVNAFGHNPAMERRILYKCLPLYTKAGKPEYLNINYILEHPDFETAYRCDVEKFENAKKLNLKKNDDYKRDEEFVNVETSFRKTRQIMLQKKFETMYTENLNDDSNPKRSDKIAERETQRKRDVKSTQPLHDKGVGERNEEKPMIKIFKGPFFKYISKEGLVEDDFSTCPQNDLIEYANKQAVRIMLFGKPRSGKTTLAKNLSKRLDVVHVNVENWLLRLQEKIKNYEPPEEELEEGQEPPKWLTELEESVNISLKAGGGPSHEDTIAILKEEVASPAAQTKGYVLDLTFYKCPEGATWKQMIRQHQILGAPDSMGQSVEFSHVIELDMEDDEVITRAKHMKLDPADGAVYSRWEITERNKPKPKKFDEDGVEIEEEEPDPDDETVVRPLDLTTLVHRVEDTEDMVLREVKNYNQPERPALDDFLVRLYNHQYLKIDCAGLTPDEIADSAEWRVRSDPTIPLRPVGKQLEGGGDFKSLLTDPLFEEQPEGTLARQWSLWKQTDPVALYNKQVI